MSKHELKGGGVLMRLNRTSELDRTFVSDDIIWRGVLVDGRACRVELPVGATEADAIAALEEKFSSGEGVYEVPESVVEKLYG